MVCSSDRPRSDACKVAPTSARSDACRKPILFVHGDRDEYGELEHLRSLVARLPAEAQAELVVVEKADHFFEGRLDELKRAITDWSQRRDEG